MVETEKQGKVQAGEEEKSKSYIENRIKALTYLYCV